MTRWVFDLESDGLLPTVSKIHCIVLRNVETNEVKTYDGDMIGDGLFLLMNAEEVIGHNIIAYDIPCIQKLYPNFDILGKVTDTLIMSRLIATTLAEKDTIRYHKDRESFPRRLVGSHSLKAWGLRLKNLKDDYEGGWAEYSQEMLDYCVQDTGVTYDLYHKLMSANFSQQSIDLEHLMATICNRIGNNGWTFDKYKAQVLYGKLAQERAEIEHGLEELFEPWEVTEVFIPKRNNKTLGYIKDEPFEKKKTVHFNPSSRRHIEHCLRSKYNWKPKKFTDGGHAQIDESVLSKLDYPEAQKLARYFMLQKRIGQLSEGSQGWLKKVDDDGRIRHTIVPGGTISGRESHRNPNLAQVPKVGLEFGKECRELFTVPDGWCLVGADLSGLELRCLASFLNDGGEYAKQILEGDIHTYNAKAFGVDRSTAKTLVYALIYGSGDQNLGKIAGGGAKLGKQLKADFNKNIPAFGQLQEKLKKAHNRGYLVGLDGRKLYVRSEHKLLSQLLQSAGAIICKQWVAFCDQQINEQYGSEQAYIVGWIHDEIQIACKNEDIGNGVGNITSRMARETGETLKVKIPIGSEYSVGRTWAATH